MQKAFASMIAAALLGSAALMAQQTIQIKDSSFTWLLLYENPKDKTQGKILSDFVKWALTDGQKFCAELGYAPLPADVVKLELAALTKLKVG